MKPDCKALVESYVLWLKDRITIADVNGACEITTPFLDRHNDRLQIYVENTENGLRLSDDGYIIGDLEGCGCPLDSAHRKRILELILNGYGVRHEDGELVVEASIEDFPRKKHALLQAMLTVNDMFMTAKPHVISLFLEDVAHYLDTGDVRYTPRVDFIGKSSLPHKFDFVIPKSRQKPERLLRAINSPSRDSATSLLFAWTDTKDTRDPDSQVYAIINDTEKPIGANVLSAFQHYDVRIVLWSHRDEYIAEFAA